MSTTTLSRPGAAPARWDPDVLADAWATITSVASLCEQSTATRTAVARLETTLSQAAPDFGSLYSYAASVFSSALFQGVRVDTVVDAASRLPRDDSTLTAALGARGALDVRSPADWFGGETDVDPEVLAAAEPLFRWFLARVSETGDLYGERARVEPRLATSMRSDPTAADIAVSALRALADRLERSSLTVVVFTASSHAPFERAALARWAPHRLGPRAGRVFMVSLPASVAAVCAAQTVGPAAVTDTSDVVDLATDLFNLGVCGAVCEALLTARTITTHPG